MKQETKEIIENLITAIEAITYVRDHDTIITCDCDCTKDVKSALNEAKEFLNAEQAVKYFVHFNIIKNGTPGDGNTILTTKIGRIIESIKEIEEVLKKEVGLDSVVVTNFIKL